MGIARTAQNEPCKRLGLMVLILGALGLLAAGAPAAAEPDHAEAWTQIDDTGLDFLFVKSGADFEGFDKITIDALSVWTLGRDKDASRIAGVQHTFETSFATKLESAGFVISDQPGEDVLRLHVEIIDLKLGEVDDSFLDQPFLFDVAPGRITFVAELRDSLTGEVLLRLADLEQRPGPGTSTSEQTERAFDTWSSQFSHVMLSMSGQAGDRPALMAHRIAE